MEDEKEKEPRSIRVRMTCLLWIAILLAIVVFARFCSLLISITGVR